MTNSKGIFFGATVGTIIGSLAVAFYPKRKEILKTIQEQSGDIAEKAKNVTQYLLNETQRYPKKNQNGYFLTGSLLGLLAGAGAGLLWAPKTGKNLRNQIAKAYTDINNKTQDFISVAQKTTHKLQKIKKPTAKSIKRKLKTLAK